MWCKPGDCVITTKPIDWLQDGVIPAGEWGVVNKVRDVGSVVEVSFHNLEKTVWLREWDIKPEGNPT